MRKAFLILGALMLVFVAVVVIAVFNIEKIVNSKRDFILAQAEKTVGRDIDVGPIDVTIFGGLGVKLRDITVADDAAFSDGSFVTARELHVRARLMPLLQKRFEVKRVELKDPVFRIIRSEKGVMNFASLMGSDDEETAGDRDTGASGGSSRGAANSDAAAFAIALVNISNGTLFYEDRSRGLALEIKKIESDVTDLDPNGQINANLKAALAGDEHDVALQAAVGPLSQEPDLSGTPVAVDLELGPIELAAVRRIYPDAFSGMPTELTADGPVSCTVEVDGTLPHLEVKTAVDATQTSLRLENGFDKPAGVPLTMRTTLRTSDETVTLEDLEVVFHEMKGQGSLTVTTGDKTPEIALEFHASDVPLAGWQEILPATATYSPSGTVRFDVRTTESVPAAALATSGALTGNATLSNVAMTVPGMIKPISDLNGNVTFTATTARVEHAAFTIGDSKLRSSATVESYEPIRVSYHVTSDALRVSDVSKPNPKATRPEFVNGLDVKGRMFQGRQQLTNRGNITSSNGTLANIDYSSLRAGFDVAGDTLLLKNIQMNAFEGTVTGSGRVTMDATAPGFVIDTRARNVNVVEALEQLPGFARAHLKGRANLDLEITGQGQEWSNIQPTLNGNGYAELLDGEIADVNVMRRVADRVSSIAGSSDWMSQGLSDKYPDVFKNPNTAFDDFKSTFVIENGRLLARNANLTAKDYVMNGKGAIGADGLDLDVTLTMSSQLSTDIVGRLKLAKYITDAEGKIVIPFKLSGTLPNVSAKPDDDFIQAAVRRALADEGQDLLRDGLKNLFGND